MDISDSYFSLIKSLVGNEQFDLWFNYGGELEGFILDKLSLFGNSSRLKEACE